MDDLEATADPAADARRPCGVPVRLRPLKVAFVHLAVVAILLGISLPLQILVHHAAVDVPARLVKAFDFDSENNLPTWLSSVGLLACALALCLIFMAKRARAHRDAGWWGGRRHVLLYQ